ncbi:MAG: protein-S-isoprenylcysteine O-methyltransferase [Pseudomonadota bacterium]
MSKTKQKRRGLLGWFVLFALLGTLAWNHASLTWPEVVWLAFPIAIMLIRLPFTVKTKDNEITVDENSGQEKVLMFLLFLTMAPIPLIYLAVKSLGWDVLGLADYALPEALSVVGACLILPFAILFWRSHYDLGKNWSPRLEMRQDHQLVTSGVYRYVRHPMYSAIWISVIAQPLLIQNMVAGGLVVPVFFAMHMLRIPKEEQMMLETFGEPYKDMMDRTGRIFPKLY